MKKNLLEIFPELSTATYIVEEKIDGNNCTVHITRDSVVYDFQLEFLDALFKSIQHKMASESITLFGKIKENNLFFFNMAIDGEIVPPRIFYDYINKFGMYKYCVPLVGIEHGINRALLVSQDKVVIKPWNNIYK